MSTTKTISLTRNVPKRKMVSQSATTDYAFIKKLIWVYFLLLLFEGEVDELVEVSQILWLEAI